MTEKDFWEFLTALQDKGRASQVSVITDNNDEELHPAIAFVSAHAFLPKNYDKIHRLMILKMGKLLFRSDTSYKAKQAMLIILAHHVSKEALVILEAYNRNPEEELKVFAEMALDECAMWNGA